MNEWTLIYHELLDITNIYRHITSADKGGNTETVPHHQLQKSKILEINEYVEILTSSIRAHGNFYSCNDNDEC